MPVLGVQYIKPLSSYRGTGRGKENSHPPMNIRDSLPVLSNSEYLKEWRASHRSLVRAYRVTWSTENRERKNNYNRLYRLRHPDYSMKQWRRAMEVYPDKVRARKSVRRALASGRLVRGLCAVCDAIDVHAHHEDYSRRLDIVWLCPMHHAERHGLLHDGLGCA